ncbi:hypothetical protein SAMN05421636_104391 [Pricia antarctica]|uniref:Cellulase (Glycosyl hydrolase family 5) n=1 Tax=Pricia antarctica TaxID=641691 RepID=A0A1G7C401_9FLAO|nr:hypothetical protein [Pricia antarctica]SDE33500.1 hypothetical protein SAMN05421636_104391 [Pricia antarctica]
MKSKRDVILVNLSIVFSTIVFLLACSKHEIDPNDPVKIGTTEDSVPTPSPQDSLPPIHPQDSIPLTFDRTTVSIRGEQFFINGRPTYEGRYWQGNKIEGLLLNSRMVQGIFDDLNPDTSQLFAYPDTHKWNADRNTDEFVASMAEWKRNGLLAFTLNLQGGSPTGYGNSKSWKNSAFDRNGILRPAYTERLKRILDKADELQMVVILGYFYFGQDQVLENEAAVINAVDETTHWILNNGYRNVVVEIANECDGPYDHDILRPNRIHELIERVHNIQKDRFRLPVSTSYQGGVIPSPEVVRASDFILLHGNGIRNPARIRDMVATVRNVDGYIPKPIVFNEDDHFNFEAQDNHLVSAVRSYSSWGYFDFRMQGEGFKSGYQSVPVDWGINSDRKRGFFSKMKEITGY